MNIIAEIKSASPSAGAIVTNPDVESIARDYARGGAAAISVVTEPEFFHGSRDWLARARNASGLPVVMKDFIVDEESWQIRYLVLDTSKLWFGESVLLPPRLATNVSFNDRTVSVDLERRAVRESPPWDPSQEITPAYEVALFEHYGQFSRPQPPAEAADAGTSHHA